jgi:hypothetical protein
VSYCRFSSDNFHSDVYVYESCYGGYQTYVAGNRVVGDIPKTPENWWKDPNKDEAIEAYLKAHNEQMEFVRTATRESIDLPHAGESFVDNSLEELLGRLLWLRSLGYNVPESAIEMIKEEIEETK